MNHFKLTILCLFFMMFKLQATELNQHLLSAQQSFIQQHFDKAEEQIKLAIKTIEKDPQLKVNGQHYYWLGLIMEKQAETANVFSASGYAKKSLNGYLKAIEIEPTNITYREALIHFYLDAPGFIGGDVNKAIEQAKIIFEQNTNNGYKNLIDCYAKDGKTVLMFSTYNAAMTEYPLDPEFSHKRGVYWWLEGEYEKAIDDFNTSLSIPEQSQHHKAIHLWSLYYIGRISLKTKQHKIRGRNAFNHFINNYQEIEGEILPSIDWVKDALVKL